MPLFPGFEPVFAPMPNVLQPSDEADLRDLLEHALEEETALNVFGHGTKAAIGARGEGSVDLSVNKLSGIIDYAPNELVLTARASTPLAEIEAVLHEQGQHLAFEPPHFDWAHGNKTSGTIGGILATNLSGPRRFMAGAARDHFLGVKAISGRAEVFKSGGRVVKNVTGYDMCKLLAGSFGTLAIMTEVTVKVLPAPEEVRTVIIAGLDEIVAVDVMMAAAQRSDPITAAAHLPTAYSLRSCVGQVHGAQRPLTLVRLEGTTGSIAARLDAVKEDLGGYGDIETLGHEASQTLWAEIRDMKLERESLERTLWRLSVPATAAADLLAALRGQAPGSDGYFEWAGGQIVYAVPPDQLDSRRLVSSVAAAGGHAMLLRYPPDLVPAFAYQPLEPNLAALNRRLRQNFDPKCILNPRRFENAEAGV